MPSTTYTPYVPPPQMPPDLSDDDEKSYNTCTEDRSQEVDCKENEIDTSVFVFLFILLVLMVLLTFLILYLDLKEENK